jgi:hypothetical protein
MNRAFRPLVLAFGGEQTRTSENQIDTNWNGRSFCCVLCFVDFNNIIRLLCRSRAVPLISSSLYPYEPSYLHTGTAPHQMIRRPRGRSTLGPRQATMPFGKRRGFSDCIRGVRARNLLSASGYAASIGRGLNTAVDINWSRTAARDDLHGDKLAAWRKAAGRFLRKHGAGGLTCTWVRERPTWPINRPNAHLNCHIPDRLYAEFVRSAHRFLPPGCDGCDPDAIYIQPIGSTGEDHRRRTEYLLKGAHPKARIPMKRKRISQGRILRKRCGTSEDIGLGARLKAAEQASSAIAAIPF